MPYDGRVGGEDDNPADTSVGMEIMPSWPLYTVEVSMSLPVIHPVVMVVVDADIFNCAVLISCWIDYCIVVVVFPLSRYFYLFWTYSLSELCLKSL